MPIFKHFYNYNSFLEPNYIELKESLVLCFNILLKLISRLIKMSVYFICHVKGFLNIVTAVQIFEERYYTVSHLLNVYIKHVKR